MKAREQRKELREAVESELAPRLAEAREELFRLRFQLHTNQLSNPMKLREVRKQVARIQTEIGARKRKGAAA